MPFLWWNVLLYPLFFVLYYWRNWNIEFFAKEVIEILLTVNKVAFLGPTWFLASLFWISILIHLFLIKCTWKYSDGMLILIGIIACAIGLTVRLPYRYDRTMILAFFYICGYLYKKYLYDRINEMGKDIFACLGVVLFLLIASNNVVDMSNHIYKHRVLYIIGAWGIIFFVLRLSEKMRNFDKLFLIHHIAYLGRNSIYVVIWHVLAFRFTFLLQIIMQDAQLKDITAFPTYDTTGVWWVVYVITGVYGSLIWKWVLEHNPLTKLMKKLHLIY